jgi:hypothetical protein
MVICKSDCIGRTDNNQQYLQLFLHQRSVSLLIAVVDQQDAQTEEHSRNDENVIHHPFDIKGQSDQDR